MKQQVPVSTSVGLSAAVLGAVAVLFAFAHWYHRLEEGVRRQYLPFSMLGLVSIVFVFALWYRTDLAERSEKPPSERAAPFMSRLRRTVRNQGRAALGRRRRAR